MTKNLPKKREYQELIETIGSLLQQARQKTFQVINNVLVRTYWEIGRLIVEYENNAGEKAEYGGKLFEKIAADLRKVYGKGFSRSNVIYMRLLYLKYQKSQTLSDQLSWSHYVGLLGVTDDLTRTFYEKECVANRWSVRELERQINSMLFERLALSRDKKGILKLAGKGQVIIQAQDVVKDPYVLEFLGIPEKHQLSEKEIEQKVIDNMQAFLLELGKGFSFVARQFRMTLNNQHFRVDLVFYHRILKCFVLMDLKLGKIAHQDIGQMNMYLNYFKKEEMAADDNEPIGIVLGAEKDHVLVEYALGGISNKLFASKYRLELPDKELLQKAVEQIVACEKEATRHVAT
ncbi:MAG: PDDEXK nuclease domain-containing protein [Candidatus Margulisbacteria bacterium]|nr:PDDEXK nuclease domain-containing protein [Candidatus Margulisiibacteriota bacterium]